MYDLQNDPHEMNNLYPDPQYAGLARQLRGRMDELRKETGDTGKYDVTQAYVDEPHNERIRQHRPCTTKP